MIKILLQSFGVIFADILVSFSAFVFCLFILISVMPHKTADANDDHTVLGRVCVELSWDNNRNVDLDLWGKSPMDKTPIGYSNMHGGGLDLFRDVVGFQNNPSHINLEVMCANHVYPGEWAFNVHYFANHELHDAAYNPDIKATIIVRVNHDIGSSTNYVKNFKGEWTFHKEGEEKTIFDFVINKQGEVDLKSINSADRPLRSNSTMH